jgi:hypothetical protein
MRLEAYWGMQRRMRQTCAHGQAQELHVLTTLNGYLRAAYCATGVFVVFFLVIAAQI